jgi:hypothetical protein
MLEAKRMAFTNLKDVTKLCAAGIIAGAVGCGDAGTTNDQGTSVTAVGFCGDVTCDTGETGRIVPLSTDVSNINSGVFPLDGQTIVTFMRVQNRLGGQFVRIDRIDCEYNVPGSDINIPRDSFGGGAVIEATPGGQPGDQFSEGIIGFEVVSPDLFAFLNVSRNSLPELPFRATAICAATGVTQAGDTITTNALNYFLQFGEVSECCTGQDPEDSITGIDDPATSSGGFQLGGGSGGTLNTFGGDDAATGAITEPEAVTEEATEE